MRQILEPFEGRDQQIGAANPNQTALRFGEFRNLRADSRNVRQQHQCLHNDTMTKIENSVKATILTIVGRATYAVRSRTRTF